ncbi:DUF6090 family protein [Ekhidna sp.]|uniref:DUF6090 family protein n=1 Tax=Ekhidna sp. TaxID=2608089 RepID=UPI003B5110AF
MNNKFTTYFLYAIGEIILVVIGILIAVSINNWNDVRKRRASELHYLTNIKKDLILNNEELDSYIGNRVQLIEYALEILEYYEGKELENPELIFDKMLPIYTWERFFQTNNTFKELVNTGNFALISNEDIKAGLLNLEAQYLLMKATEAHFRFDSEVALFLPSYESVDHYKLYKNYLYRTTNGQMGENTEIKREDLAQLDDLRQKNGFVMALAEFTKMNQQMVEMKQMSFDLIAIIDTEKANY